jgi:NADPH2:quinone reductase
MRAAVCHDFEDSGPLTVGTLPSPDLAAGCVRIQVRAAGVNFADTLIVKGEYQVKPPLPFAPGLEVSGFITEVASDVTSLQVGDRVMACIDYGGFAEEAVARATDAVVMPDNMTFVEAAGFPIVYGTSHIGLVNKLKLQAGETLLVHGAAGGVGLTAVEIGERVKALTDGRGADAVYDPVGGSVFDATLRATAQGGRILLVGFASGTVPQIPANILLVKNITAIGYYWGAHRKLDPQLVNDSFAELMTWYADGKVKPHVSHVFPLEDVQQALDTLAQRKSTGKVVVTFTDADT